ncbi:Cna protein B-type domain protein [Eubacteriaceae bacterium CHKCI005]|nr:Cna protein B-type domain protein [Eubacteriaceae bacterium CHKCI005]
MQTRQTHTLSNRKRLLAILMAFVLILGCYFAESLVAMAVQNNSLVPRAADPSSMTNWETSLGQDVPDTSSAGRIWTDKTVSDNDVVLRSEDGWETLKVERSSDENFLVSLSAISSNKSIVGQDTIPIDVMLVLDVSGSMDDAGAVSDLVTATNKAIQKLLELNVNNRVGVVLFSDVGDGEDYSNTVLLPLDRYTSRRGGTYVEKTNGGWLSSPSIRVADGVTNEQGENIEGKRYVVGATYIQSGLYQAWNQFESVSDTTVEGIKRIPVMVLMGDGAPTRGTNRYSNVDNENGNEGNGRSTSNELGFYTQLTAAYVRAQMRIKYDREPLFYTLGLGINGLSGDQKRVAQWVLNPESTPEPGSWNQTVGNWWERFLTLEPEENLSEGWNYRNYPDVVRQDDGIQESDKVYADQYFEATNNSGLENAFEQIVQEIILQSQYYPTDVDTDGANFSGYLTFKDEIGEYMEVKHVNGLVYANQLHTGQVFAKAFRDGFHPEDGGDNLMFLRSVMERLNITAEQAKALIDNAIEQKQIYYRSSDNFSNVIIWYGKGDVDNQQYVGPYREGQDPPSEAQYLNYSYSYYGSSGEQTATGADMMYISARVEMELATGKQTVLLKVPSSLVPMVRYKVTIDGKDLEAATKATTERKEAYPMRFFYEVGLKNVTPDNVQFAVKDDYKYYDPDTDTYTFYTNAWSEQNGQKEANTVVTFEPSQENEFYCFPKDTKIYDQDGNLCTNWRVQPINGYYFKQTFKTGKDEFIKREYAEIQTGALRYAQWNEQEGYWYIPMGTPRYAQLDYVMEKEQNATDTASYSIHPYVVGEDGKTWAEVYLGNNGRIQLQQTYGDLQIEKIVTGNHGETDREFEFDLTLTNPDDTPFTPLPTASYTYTKTEIESDEPQTGTIEISQKGTVIFDGQPLTLKGGEQVVIHGLPTGTKYVVQERDPNLSGEDYKTSVTIDGGEPIAGRESSGVIAPPGTGGTVRTQIMIFTNHWEVPDVPFSFTKVDGKDYSLPLEGAEFKIFRLTCSEQEGTHTHTGLDQEGLLDEEHPGDCWQLVKTVSSDAGGLVDFGDLTEGAYRLIETKAPDGYTLPKGQWDVRIDPSKTSLIEWAVIEGVANPPAVKQVYAPDGVTVTGYKLLNNKPIDPPVTGGRGTNQFLLLGSLTMALGIGGIFCARKGAKRYRRL